MPGTRKGTGVYVGPVEGPRGRKYRVRVRNAAGESCNPSFDSREEAEEFRKSALSELELDRAIARAEDLDRQAKEAWAFVASLENRDVTVGQAVERYEAALRERGLRPVSIRGQVDHLRWLRDIFELPMRSITEKRAKEVYRARTQATNMSRGREGQPIRASTHQSELKHAKYLWRFAIEEKLTTGNPFEAVKPIGQANVGKEQLSTEEARLLDAALVAALASEDLAVVRRALGAALALYQGFRRSEIVRLQVRFVTADGSGIEIRKAKTRAGNRPSRVPDFLAAPLARVRAAAKEQTEGEGRDASTALLLPFAAKWVLAQAHRFCDAAGVPRVCAHALRGMHGTLAMEGGETAEAVARALGHTSTGITLKHYVEPATAHTAATERALRVLKGGKGP